MGYIMGNFNAKQKVDNWNNVNTEDISSTIPYMSGMNKESKDLTNVLANYLITETDSEKTNKTFMKKYNITNNEHIERTSTELSATSPFITSDLYNKMVTNNMQGGGKNDSSSTSTTSDYGKKQSSEKIISKSEISTKESPVSKGEFSYQSSSAHTGGSLSSENNLKSPSSVEENNSKENNSDENKSKENNSDENKSKENVEKTSEEAVTIENNESEVSKKEVLTSSEVNTRDINMVSINTE